MTSRGGRIAAAVIVSLAVVTIARIALIDHLADQGYFAKYVTFADRILRGDVPRSRLGDLSPAYLWTVVVCRAIGMSIVSIRSAQIVALSLAALFCGFAAWRLGGWIAAIAAAVAILGNRAALVIAAELEPETLIVLLLSAALAAIVAWRLNALAGVLVGLAVVARPSAAAALILIALWIAWRDRRAAIAFVLAALVPIVVVLLVNRSLTGSMWIMDPGTGLYDGNNALATGCAGVLPRIVADLDAASTEPDYLHVAYRIVAARASGVAGNRYWSDKSAAWMRAYPLAAGRLFARKAWMTIASYDVYDLATTKRKADELSRWPDVAFGILVALALAAMALHGERRELVPPALFAIATCVALVAFNVSARQRDALLPPLAILAAAGVAHIVRRRAAIVAVAVVAIAVLLAIETHVESEETFGWTESFARGRLMAIARDALAHGDRLRAAAAAAQASVLDTANEPVVSATTLRTFALRAANDPNPPVRFDAAIALEKSGAWPEADAVLASIESYAPRRENRAVSSVAYYRARAAMHLHRDPRQLLRRANGEAPGDPNVLALTAVNGDADSMRRLDALHDPFTRDFALACAWLDAGDRTQAFALRDRLLREFPEWRRPNAIR